jgi:hypothetical protein
MVTNMLLFVHLTSETALFRILVVLIIGYLKFQAIKLVIGLN